MYGLLRWLRWRFYMVLGSRVHPHCLLELRNHLRSVVGREDMMAMAVPCCHPFYGTACAFGLTWRPFTGSLFLSSFWCRLKPGPSGERVGSHRLSVSSYFLLSCSGTSSSSGALGRAPRGTQGLFQDARNTVFSVREELRSRSR